MLKPEQNRALMEVGPGTSMGELLRRYWLPFGAAAELDKQPTRTVRLLGEDLVVYKDKSGNLGLVDRHCPHRRADMSYGWVEECGLRCNYHGWKFDHEGACIHQPFEEISHPDAKFAERITAMYGGEQWIPIAESRRNGLLSPPDTRAELINLMRFRLERTLGYKTTHAFTMKNTIASSQ